MDPLEKLPCKKDEIALKQVDEIFNIFKSIRSTIKNNTEIIEKKYGFTIPQLRVISCLYEASPITLNELADRLVLSNSTVSGIVDRLTNQGVVNREIPRENRRTVRLSICEDFKKNNSISDIKNILFTDIIYDRVKTMDSLDVEKIIYGLEQFNLLLKCNDLD